MYDIYKIPVGNISIFWDYDDIDEIKDAFYLLEIVKKNNNFEFINNFYFLDNNLCNYYENVSTNDIKIFLLNIEKNKKIKIQICGNIIYLDKDQYKLLNEKLTKIQEKLKFNLEIIEENQKK